MNDKCMLCAEKATTAVRGTFEKQYATFCSFHAGSIQMIFELIKVSDDVKWRPLYETLHLYAEKEKV